MNAGTKLGLYGALLAAVLGGGAAIGAVAGPIDVGSADPHADQHEPTEEVAMTSTLPAGGLLVSQDGYTFEPDDRQLDGGPTAFTFTFTITGPDGQPVTAYEELHDRELHLIVASRDLHQYAHLHPRRDAAGRWSVEVPELPAGSYRAFADFRPAGDEQLTLGVDLAVGGPAATPEPLAASTTDDVAGFAVSLEADPHDGTATVTVRRDGEVVATEPYLGAAGHLVALRDGDLAYLHVHPLDPEAGDGPPGSAASVPFAVEYPSAGTYALFFDFQVDGQVHTARFVVESDGTSDGH